MFPSLEGASCRLISENHLHDLAVCLLFLVRVGLCLEIHRFSDVSMAHEFLLHFDVFSVEPQPSGKRALKRVPTY